MLLFSVMIVALLAGCGSGQKVEPTQGPLFLRVCIDSTNSRLPVLGQKISCQRIRLDSHLVHSDVACGPGCVVCSMLCCIKHGLGDGI